MLWIDDTKMDKRWLSTLTVLLREKVLSLGEARLSIVGPHNSDKLVDTLGEDLAAVTRESKDLSPGARDAFVRNWKTLLRLS